MGDLWIPSNGRCCYVGQSGLPCNAQAIWRLYDNDGQYTELCDEHLHLIKESEDIQVLING